MLIKLVNWFDENSPLLLILTGIALCSNSCSVLEVTFANTFVIMAGIVAERSRTVGVGVIGFLTAVAMGITCELLSI